MSTQGRCPRCGHALHREPCLNAASDNDCSCPGSNPPRCHVQQASLVDDWTSELNLEQQYDHNGCTSFSAWEYREGNNANKWLPICTLHYAVMRDRKDYAVMEFRRPLLSYIIDEEPELVLN